MVTLIEQKQRIKELILKKSELLGLSQRDTETFQRSLDTVLRELSSEFFESKYTLLAGALFYLLSNSLYEGLVSVSDVEQEFEISFSALQNKILSLEKHI